MTIEKFKKALGKTGKRMSDEQIQNLIVKFDSLIDGWLDMKEIEIFGRPIKILLEE